jgi:hypothetical protein
MREESTCPCVWAKVPCNPRCTCVTPVSSFGCSCCCSYGSEEQRQAMGDYLVAKQKKVTVKITIAGNVDTACLNKLLDKGYKLKVKDSEYIAEKDGNTFVGLNAIELLGVVCLFEEDGEKWGLNDRDNAWKEIEYC